MVVNHHRLQPASCIAPANPWIRKLIMAQANLAQIVRNIQVGIWDNLSEVITVYPDRTLVKSYTVRWVNNSGSLKPTNKRITGAQHVAILQAIKNAEADEVDPEDYIMEVMEHYYY